MSTRNIQKVRIKNQQSLLEIALQEYGSLEGLYLIQEDNPDFGEWLMVVYQGYDVLIRKDAVIDKKVLRKYANEGITPANVYTIFSATKEIFPEGMKVIEIQE